MQRRDFIKATSASGAIALTQSDTTAVSAASTRRPEVAPMIYRELGTTGERVSAIGLGGYHIGKQKAPEESYAIVRSAIDRGITFMDNCWDYNDGLSEVRMGEALKGGYRQKVFLMTKIDGRSGNEYNKQLEQSLGRLQTDVIDLVQFHECIRLDDPDRIFKAGGALEAAIAARQAGKIRYIGFTGHKDPAVHLRMFAMAKQHDFKFDAAQMPINVMDPHFRSFLREVVPVANAAGTGVLAMKTFGDPFILDTKLATPEEMLHFSLSQPVSVVVTGIDTMPILDQALAAAQTFRHMPSAAQIALLARTADAAAAGKYELFKTTPHFDGTASHPQWLGTDDYPAQT